jgi:hydrogenase maturation protein HypF
MTKTYQILIKGTVQGVGFRPFVYNLAKKEDLLGEVKNDATGVVIELNVTSDELESFIEALRKNLPPLAKIDHIAAQEIETKIFKDFSIAKSAQTSFKTALIPPDISICKACEKELFDPTNRRYLYPFITCTDCGVRYSIIKTLPYDRKNTSMEKFKMCSACEAEYHDPSNRRYHAQPIGCFECGPELRVKGEGRRSKKEGVVDLIEEAVRALEDGKILAVKGVGGYHLVCDATSDEAVVRLRERKHRPGKPFAVMVEDVEIARKLAVVDMKEEALLTSKERPIVLLKAKKNSLLSSFVAPNISKIGLFLPYTPLHLLLLKKFGKPIVATSANVTDEPICTDQESLERLKDVWDMVIDHDREIVNGCDDSVVMVVAGKKVTLRRARGYAPSSVKLPFKLDQKVLALGANQKSTVAIAFDKEAILSPHIGDLDGIASVDYFHKNITSLRRIYDFIPDIVIHDKHPNYESTKYAKANFKNLKAIQHHYAHILGVMAERGIKKKVLGVAFDGTGYGDDGNLWGGEFMVCDYAGYERVAHLRYFKLLGGAKAIKEPRRVALSFLFELYDQKALEMDHPTLNSFSKMEQKTLFLSWQKGLNTPLSSSCGRLFDGVASLLDVCHKMSFEGESGMLLEEYYDVNIKEVYPFTLKEKEINFLPMIEALLHEKSKTIAVSKFFNTLVEIIVIISKKYDLPVVLSGGVFQNKILLELVLKRLPDAIISHEVPPNDGGIALGQVACFSERNN